MLLKLSDLLSFEKCLTVLHGILLGLQRYPDAYILMFIVDVSHETS